MANCRVIVMKVVIRAEIRVICAEKKYFISFCKLISSQCSNSRSSFLSYFWCFYGVWLGNIEQCLLQNITAWKVSVFGVFLVCIFPHLDWIRTRKTSNTDTFHAVHYRPLNEKKLTWRFAGWYAMWALICSLPIAVKIMYLTPFSVPKNYLDDPLTNLTSTAWKVSKHGVISSSYFPVFRHFSRSAAVQSLRLVFFRNFLNDGFYGCEIFQLNSFFYAS